MQRELRACAVLMAVAAVALLSGCGGSGEQAGTTTSGTPASGLQLGPGFGSMASLPGVLTGRPPWPANGAKLQPRLRAIGLDPLSEEGQALHIHQHLDLFVDGKPVPVPANVGIDPGDAFIAALHTHDDTGIVHVESPVVTSYTLGQFFAVWGVRLDARCIGGLCAQGARSLRAWVGGKPVDADPTRIVLAEHQEIVLAYGTAAQVPDPLPKSYDWAAAGV